MKKLKRLPKFRSEDAERMFWAEHSPLEYVNASNAEITVFPNLKPSSRTISIRLPESLVEGIKALANKEDVSYQSMLKILLAEKVRERFKAQAKRQRAA